MSIPNTWGTPHGGYGGYGGPPPVPPVIPARDLRPLRLWYVVAALLGLVLVGAGVTFIVLTVKDTVKSVDTAHTFAGGSQRTFAFTAGRTRAIYVSQSARGHVDCRLPRALADSLTTPDGTFRVTLGARSWERVFEFTPKATGDYPVGCTSDVPAEFALGDKPRVGGMVGGIFAAIGCFLAAAVVVPGICVVTAVRRGRHRRRLTTAWAPPPPQWGPPVR
ncbi:serine/arginine repetitive matrix protein 2 [Streptomyces sp. NPDC048106]|uniref:serine/arginine repetitive matrix protein 2 n=1 Tax=Streptomyces sp. NPDC048106 TaxID=3155750 RepID=UPI0034550164